MGSAVVGFEEYHVNTFEQFVDRINDLNAEVFDLFGVFGHPFHTGRDVRATFGVSDNHAKPGDVCLSLRVVKDFDECRGVARVQPDDTDPDGLSGERWRTMSPGRCNKKLRRTVHLFFIVLLSVSVLGVVGRTLYGS